MSPRLCSLLVAASLLSGCASTRVETSGMPLKPALCTPGSARLSVAVLWGPQWRVDQKEPPLREAAALRGIERYFKGLDCLDRLAIHRVILPDPQAPLSDAQLLAMAEGDAVDRVILIMVRELGPKLLIGIPTLVEGGTEVVLEARVIDRASASALAQVRTHWQKGGPFYIKGVKTLDQDMQTALGHVFSATDARE
ncbi:hypothetical protein [Aquabacterium sp.]|uniref:hypothetical protein n=1 Tax=Aquabacterium sp. TaxID=1872578 RepID=UPI004037F84B